MKRFAHLFLIAPLLSLSLLGCGKDPAKGAGKKEEKNTDSPSVAQTDEKKNSDEKESLEKKSDEKKVTESREFLIDVRSQKEWDDEGHLENAILIPHNEIVDRIAEVTEDKSSKLVLYCRSGGRAGRAKAALEKLGFTNVENAGGYQDLKKKAAEKAK